MGYKDIKNKYVDNIARNYEKIRTCEPKWKKEQEAVSKMILNLSGTVLDIPIGTGRFIKPCLENNLSIIGIDSSKDMLNIASKKFYNRNDVILKIGDILNIDLDNKSVNNSICVRILNWLTPNEMNKAIQELIRVTKNKIILSIRLSNKDNRTKFFKEALKTTNIDEKIEVDRNKDGTYYIISLKV